MTNGHHADSPGALSVTGATDVSGGSRPRSAYTSALVVDSKAENRSNSVPGGTPRIHAAVLTRVGGSKSIASNAMASRSPTRATTCPAQGWVGRSSISIVFGARPRGTSVTRSVKRLERPSAPLGRQLARVDRHDVADDHALRRRGHRAERGDRPVAFGRDGRHAGDEPRPCQGGQGGNADGAIKRSRTQAQGSRGQHWDGRPAPV